MTRDRQELILADHCAWQAVLATYYARRGIGFGRGMDITAR